jgi:hypothetical protein
MRRIVRIEGILRVIGADAADPDRVRRAEASVAKLKAQLSELQAGEKPLSEQVCERSASTPPRRTPALQVLDQHMAYELTPELMPCFQGGNCVL